MRGHRRKRVGTPSAFPSGRLENGLARYSAVRPVFNPSDGFEAVQAFNPSSTYIQTHIHWLIFGMQLPDKLPGTYQECLNLIQTNPALCPVIGRWLRLPEGFKNFKNLSRLLRNKYRSWEKQFK